MLTHDVALLVDNACSCAPGADVNAWIMIESGTKLVRGIRRNLIRGRSHNSERKEMNFRKRDSTGVNKEYEEICRLPAERKSHSNMNESILEEPFHRGEDIISTGGPSY